MGWIRFDYLLMFENILEMMMHACSQTVVLIVAFMARAAPIIISNFELILCILLMSVKKYQWSACESSSCR